jgi:hypothetical protein
MSKVVRSVIQKLAGDAVIQTYLCKVKSVNKDVCECEPVNGGANFLAVQLRAVTGLESGILITPKVDSHVIIGLLENDEAQAFVMMYGEIETIELRGDAQGGLVQIKELKENIDALKKFVEAMHQALPSAFNAILPTAPAPFVASGALGATTYTGAMGGIIITIKDMENKKVKHG